MSEIIIEEVGSFSLLIIRNERLPQTTSERASERASDEWS